ncbi:MAG: hypothetical protein Q8O40_01355 [Chloroflexota bacterium]|nr:hypothetical protein [Chloroflexota bacterium]
MTIVRGYINRFDQAAGLAFAEAQASDMKPEAAALFATTLEPAITHGEVKKLVSAGVRSAYGKGCEWEIERWWQVPVPMPRYEASEIPCLIVEGQVYVVCRVDVSPEPSDNSRRTSIVMTAGKLQKTTLPLFFLRSLRDGNLHHYPKVARDGGWISWRVVGTEHLLRLHDDFVGQLSRTLRVKPVADWLDDFGRRGRKLAPLVVGSLLGMMYQPTTTTLPLERQPVTREQLVAVITSLGYSAARASKLIEKAAHELVPGMALEDATRILLKYAAQEG